MRKIYLFIICCILSTFSFSYQVDMSQVKINVLPDTGVNTLDDICLGYETEEGHSRWVSIRDIQRFYGGKFPSKYENGSVKMTHLGVTKNDGNGCGGKTVHPLPAGCGVTLGDKDTLVVVGHMAVGPNNSAANLACIKK